MSFSDINCEDFEEKAKNEDENDDFHNFHHAHRVSQGFICPICQDGSSCESPFNVEYLRNSSTQSLYCVQITLSLFHTILYMGYCTKEK